jgi:hypothetical protein
MTPKSHFKEAGAIYAASRQTAVLLTGDSTRLNEIRMSVEVAVNTDERDSVAFTAV